MPARQDSSKQVAQQALRSWIILFLLALLPIALLAQFTYRITSNSVKKLVHHHNQAAATTSAQLIEREFQNAIHLGQAITSMPEFSNALQSGKPSRMRPKLQGLVSTHQEIERALVVNNQGRILSDYPQVPEQLGQDRSRQSWFQGVKDRRSAYLSGIYTPPKSPQKHMLALAIPILDENNTIQGILAYQYRAKVFSRWLENIQIGEEGYLFIIDPEGRVASHPELDQLGKTLEEPFSRFITQTQNQSSEAPLQKEYTDPHSENSMVGSFNSFSLTGQKWTIAAAQPTDRAFAPIQKLGLQISLFAVVLVILAIFFVIRLGKANERSYRLRLQLKDMNEKLDEARNELESRVRERTSKLAQTNEALESEISEKKQAERERIKLLEDAQNANRLKDEFLATLSHELRTPVHVITGFAELLKRKDLSEEEKEEAVDAISRKSQTLAELIDDLLDVSNIIQGQLLLHPQPVRIQPLIEKNIENLQIALEAKQLHLEKDIDPEVGPIYGDPPRLQQIIWHLLFNATKFTPKNGTIQVRYQAWEEEKVKLEMTDNGEGIDPDFLPYIFERFRQQDSSSTRRYSGLGLGLAMVRYLVELHGGEVHATSPGIGQGSTFTVIFPQSKRQSADPAGKEAQHSLSEEGSTSPEEKALPSRQDYPLNEQRIMIIDDDSDIRSLVEVALRHYGAQVQTANSSQDALAQIENSPPDAILADINMPGENGYAFLKRLKKWEEEKGYSIPIAALTGYAAEEDKNQVSEAGFNTHLSKPVDIAQMVRTVSELLSFNNRS